MSQPFVANNPPTLTDQDANVILYLTLGLVLAITLGYAATQRKEVQMMQAYSKDDYVAARNSQGPISLTLSYFVSGAGAWVIFAVPQAAVAGGWIALFGYSLGAIFPLLLMGWLAPKMRENVPNGFTLNEYVFERFGLPCTIYMGVVSLFYMQLYLCAELSSASSIMTGLTLIKVQDDTWWENDNVFVPAAISPILGTALITLFYTAVGGLPASLLTDRIQGVGIFFLVLIVSIASYSEAGIGWQKAWDDAVSTGIHPVYTSNDYGNSIAIGISLCLGVTTANMVHAGYWQRIWAAETNKAVLTSTYAASVMTIIMMVMVGVTGWIAVSQFQILVAPGVPGGDLSWLSVPWIIVTFLDKGWAVVTIVLVISMIASTADTLQSGISALLWPVANSLFPKLTENMKLVIIVGAMILLNVPPVLLALSGQSILQLFLLADLLAAGVVAPLFLGLSTTTHPIAAFCGCVAGHVTTVVVYAVGEAYNEGFDELVEQGGIFRRVAAYAFCLSPVISALVTVGVGKAAFPAYAFEGYKNSASAAAKDVQLTTSTSAAPQASAA